MNKYWKGGLVIFIILAAVVGGWAILNSSNFHTSVVASGHPEWPPIMFQNGGVIDGVGPALVKEIFDQLGVQTSFPYSGTWNQVQAKAKSGEVDVLVAAYKTDAREQYMDYSDAYVTDPIVLFVAKGKTFPYSKFSDLLSKKGVATVGDSYGQEFDDYSAANLNLTRVATTQDAFGMVASGTAQYFIYSLYAGQAELKDANEQGMFEALPTPVAEEDFYITISKKSPFVKYLPQINALIAKYKADGTIDQLVAQYSAKQ